MSPRPIVGSRAQLDPTSLVKRTTGRDDEVQPSSLARSFGGPKGPFDQAPCLCGFRRLTRSPGQRGRLAPMPGVLVRTWPTELPHAKLRPMKNDELEATERRTRRSTDPSSPCTINSARRGSRSLTPSSRRQRGRGGRGRRIVARLRGARGLRAAPRRGSWATMSDQVSSRVTFSAEKWRFARWTSAGRRCCFARAPERPTTGAEARPDPDLTARREPHSSEVSPRRVDRDFQGGVDQHDERSDLPPPSSGARPADGGSNTARTRARAAGRARSARRA